MTQLLRDVVAGKEPLENVQIDLHLTGQEELLKDLGPCSVVIHGTGTGIWEGNEQFRLPSEEILRLLEQFQGPKFSALSGTLGQAVHDPRLGHPDKPASSIKLTVGTLAKTVTQYPGGDQSPEFAELAAAVKRVSEAAVRRTGKKCESFEQGLAMLATGDLAPETFSGQVVAYRQGQGTPGVTGWQFSWSGGRLTAARIPAGAADAEYLGRITPAQLTALLQAFRAEGFGRVPPKVWSPFSINVSAAVLNHSHAVQAQPLPTSRQGATRADEQRLARLAESLHAFQARVLHSAKAGAPPAENIPGGDR